MIVKQVKNFGSGQVELRKGMNILADAVCSTLGPEGRPAIIESEHAVNGLIISKDGVTVAKSISLENPIENMAVQIMKQAADRTAIVAGDGTTTSICLTRAILEEAYEQMGEDNNKSEVIRAIVEVSKMIDKNLTAASKKITNKRLLDVATISANNDKVTGKLIADAYSKASLVTVENSMTTSSYYEVIEGIKINRGFSSKFFVTDHKKNEAVLDNALVLITDQEINTLESIEPVLAFCVKNNKPLFIIGELAPAVLNTLNMNVIQKRIKFGNCIPPAMGYRKEELLTDLAIALGAKYYSERTGDILTSISVDGLGFAKKVIIGQENTIIIKSEEEQVVELEDHINQLKDSIKLQSNPSAIDFLNERIANISGGIAVIHVGAETDIEQKELYDRVEDAVLAVRASLEEGILPGGGIGLINACESITYKDSEDFNTAVDIVFKALEYPFLQILENSGIEEPDSFVHKICAEDAGYGYNVKTKEFGDMIKMGIIDPAKVTKSALKNAVSVATTILSTSTIISNIRA
jgi:chaperonin GroEL